MFGHPTGVGALIATHEALGRLDRPWFAGGTVDFVSVEHRMHQLRPGAEAFEDGTPNFVGIAGVSIGLDFLDSVGVDRIGAWVGHLASRMREGLSARRRSDGTPAVQVYGPRTGADCGGTIAFNLLDARGRAAFYEPIEMTAGRHRIHLRGGCFCNPGAAEAAFGFSGQRSRDCLERLGPGAFSIARFAECLGGEVPTGALRASLGVASNEADVDRLLAFVGTCEPLERSAPRPAPAGDGGDRRR
jgi:selenocysteine lyase/cysteine desulfurase